MKIVYQVCGISGYLQHIDMHAFMRRGERGIINAVERCMNLWEEWKIDACMVGRMGFEQSVRMLMKAIPEEWKDPQFIDDLHRICLDLLDRKGIAFVKDSF